MIGCSLGDLEQLKVMHSLSGYTFVEIALPLEAYEESDSFAVTTDKEREFVITSSEAYPAAGGQMVLKATGLLKDHEKYLQIVPKSFEGATPEQVLNSIAIKGGSKEKVSFVNLALTQGQLAILMANMSAKAAFVDFEKASVAYYSDLYKEKAQEAPVKFRRVRSRVPQAGAYLYGDSNEGVIPEDAMSAIAFDQCVNIPAMSMKHVVENYNELARIFEGMQSFVWDQDLELGACVLSPLLKSKCVVCAREEIWTTRGHTNIYYAV